ncbi:MAG: hypothetical protein ACFFCS_29890 [Candidatus Hodarchaeota archaeon]
MDIFHDEDCLIIDLEGNRKALERRSKVIGALHKISTCFTILHFTLHVILGNPREIVPGFLTSIVFLAITAFLFPILRYHVKAIVAIGFSTDNNNLFVLHQCIQKDVDDLTLFPLSRFLCFYFEVSRRREDPASKFGRLLLYLNDGRKLNLGKMSKDQASTIEESITSEAFSP